MKPLKEEMDFLASRCEIQSYIKTSLKTMLNLYWTDFGRHEFYTPNTIRNFIGNVIDSACECLVLVNV